MIYASLSAIETKKLRSIDIGADVHVICFDTHYSNPSWTNIPLGDLSEVTGQFIQRLEDVTDVYRPTIYASTNPKIANTLAYIVGWLAANIEDEEDTLRSNKYCDWSVISRILHTDT
jgi:hypothetical protein